MAGLFFKQPNIEKMARRKDVRGLIRALKYEGVAGKSNITIDLPYIKAELPWNIRKNAAYCLGEIGDPRAIEPLIWNVLYDGGFSATEAAEALCKIGTPALGQLQDAQRGFDGMNNGLIKKCIDSIKQKEVLY